MLAKNVMGAVRIVTDRASRHPVIVTLTTVAISLVPFLACLAYVRAFGVTVVYSDQWEMVALFRKSDVGLLTFADLFEVHNEHRFFFPRLVMLGLGHLTGWNNVAEMHLISILLATSTGLMFFAFRRSFGSRYILLFVPIAFLILTLRQHLNLLWGYQITFVLTQLAAVVSLYALYSYSMGKTVSGRRTAFAVAVLFAVVASGSSVQGLMVWIAGLLTLMLNLTRNRDAHGASFRMLVLWILAGVSVWVLYFSDYPPSSSSSPLTVLSEPLFGLTYFFSIVGGSLSLSQPQVAVVGVLIVLSLVSTVYFMFERGGWELLGRYSFWVSVCAFALLVLALITAGRFSNGIAGATTSRYVTFSVLLVVGCYALSVGLWRERRGMTFPGVQVSALALVVLFSQAIYLDDAYVRGSSLKKDREAVARVVLDPEGHTNREIESSTKFNPQGVRTRASTLEKLDLNVYR